MALYYASQLAGGDFLVHVISSIPYLRLDIWSKTLDWTNFNAHKHRSLICLWFSSLSFYLSFVCTVFRTHTCFAVEQFVFISIAGAVAAACSCCCGVWWLDLHGTLLVRSKPTGSLTEMVNEWTTDIFFFRSVRQKFTCIVGKSLTVDFDFQTELLFSLCV